MTLKEMEYKTSRTYNLPWFLLLCIEFHRYFVRMEMSMVVDKWVIKDVGVQSTNVQSMNETSVLLSEESCRRGRPK
jgi:hypothetical protein